MIDQLIAFVIAAALLTFAPGPDIIYVLVQSVVNGKKAGVITAAGLVSGIVIHTSLVAFGLAALIKEEPIALWGIKVVGACYLLYLAWKTYCADAEVQFKTDSAPRQKSLQLYKRGFIMNLVNPKVVIFFLAFFPGFLWDSTGNLVVQFYSLGGLFLLQAFIIFCGVAFFADKISANLRQNTKLGVWFKWLQIVVFMGIAGFVLV